VTAAALKTDRILQTRAEESKTVLNPLILAVLQSAWKIRRTKMTFVSLCKGIRKV
jgi:hypothetical protein